MKNLKNKKQAYYTFPFTLWMGSTTTATALSDKASKLCWVLISTPDNQQPKPGWLWYQPTTISGLKQREHLRFFKKYKHLSKEEIEMYQEIN